MSSAHPTGSPSAARLRIAAPAALALLGLAVRPAVRADEPPLPPAPAAAPAAPLDLPTLEERLRDTSAIGLFTKLSIKNQVDDLIAQFRAFHAGRRSPTLAQLRERFELLVLKVVTLLQDDDPALASAVTASREALWAVLSDPKKFADV
jgi:hypothetical protein